MGDNSVCGTVFLTAPFTEDAVDDFDLMTWRQLALDIEPPPAYVPMQDGSAPSPSGEEEEGMLMDTYDEMMKALEDDVAEAEDEFEDLSMPEAYPSPAPRREECWRRELRHGVRRRERRRVGCGHERAG